MSGSKGPGVFAIVGPNWVGTLPQGVTPFYVKDNYSNLLFRADKFVLQNGQYVDMEKEAEKFRKNLLAQSLSDYLKNPNKGAADILPERKFAAPIKTLADGLSCKRSHRVSAHDAAGSGISYYQSFVGE